MNPTICAISSGQHQAAIALIRISGEEALRMCDTFFVAANKAVTLSTMQPNSIKFGRIFQQNELIDEVLVSVFKAPHSFTGEDMVEIACHGSSFIQQQILQLLIQQGCQLAQPGEFTRRAFLNGKMDLSQAEAVADLIAAQSASSHRVAMNQMRGGFSKELAVLRDKLLEFTALIELELDFSEEDVEFADRSSLMALATIIQTKLASLARSFEVGNVIKNGIPVAIVGETNAGKSTLLNLLLNEEKAIVSDIHGTTRDVIEDIVSIQGITYRFIDTAGIRETQDAIEKMGIKRTYQQIEQASIILWVIDSTQVNEHIDWMAERIVSRSEGKKLILVFNKLDKINEEECRVLELLFENITAERLFISAAKHQHIDALLHHLHQAAAIPSIGDQDVIITNMRHFQALTQALSAIERVQTGLSTGLSGDFVSQDIRECLHYLGEITGQISNDEVLGAIFSRFCIGK
ncbi:MAG: tRNA uridine-5-carboxymethylaminomethyl(34) synthesis GTPase MnmE [Paludibacteraceae bacterium]|nr:tRNA uridine-5-carboxymethylaminomethyl(34) synthesis GTPase MnmE [Paludibacteraceae bacterium]MBP9648416.1 tRNA uridine-5-carboxymethylaminomethyl(34) synthesis GTPase MnmE [Paludibacteraceae bacterium]